MRVSICCPYWNRAAALRALCENLSSTYLNAGVFDLELVICDDGSEREPARDVMRSGLFSPDRVIIVERPVHSEPKCPVFAIEDALRAATGDIVLLQSPENLHTSDIVIPIVAELLLEPRRYIICACRNAGAGSGVHGSIEWYEHSVHRKIGHHWCTATMRENFLKALPLDLMLQLGHCYDDNDLRNRMHNSGLEFVWRDDLVVEHHRDLQQVGSTRTHWRNDLIKNNQRAYLSLWGTYWPNTKLGEGE